MNVEKTFEGKNIFLTGGTGFIGKALIEKILRTIPNVGKIYVLMRNKKGKQPQERLNDLFDTKLFEKLRELNPGALEKVVAIEGDVQKLELGMNTSDKTTLLNDVDIIYHCAACVRFNDPLTSAIVTNVRSTREVINLAMEAKHLKAFVHVSTAYCNVNKRITVMEEKLYPQNGDWRQAIDLAEKGEENLVDILTKKYTYPNPNTYTFTKALAEHLVSDMCLGKIPTAIVRPTVVTNSLREPISGWTDNFNGPIGLSIAFVKGILRSTYGNKHVALDYVPVDATVNVMLLIACETMKQQNTNTVEVYNTSRYQLFPLTFESMKELTDANLSFFSINQAMWYPLCDMTKCKYSYFIVVLLFQMLPALLIDFLSKIAGKKSRLAKTQRKIYIANVMLKDFMLNGWLFINSKVLELEKRLSPTEFQKFGYSPFIDRSKEQFLQYLEDCLIRIDADLLNVKPDPNLNKEAKLWRLWILDVITKLCFAMLFIWLLIKYNILESLCGRIENYFNRL